MDKELFTLEIFTKNIETFVLLGKNEHFRRIFRVRGKESDIDHILTCRFFEVVVVESVEGGSKVVSHPLL